MRRIETDYLVVGAGAVGMAFADTLVAHSAAEVLLVDRRFRPGGHWHDAYPFVRLHVPSAYYGVDSLPLGHDSVDSGGPNAGMYELATAAEIVAYFGRVLDDVLLPSGRVRFEALHDHTTGAAGEHLLTSRVTGETVEVEVRRRVVDATYLQGKVPGRRTPSYDVEPGVRLVPPGGLVEPDSVASSYVVLGAGKTAIDACLWLLDHGVAPDSIRWVRAHDPWLADRAGWQPLAQVASVVDGLSRELEALAQATDLPDLLLRLEACGRLLRLDPAVLPGRYRCATVSRPELEQLRRIENVVRLGKVVRLHLDRIDLEQGSVRTAPTAVHVDCTANGIGHRPARPVFAPGLVTVQPVRTCLPTFNAALAAWVEAHRDDDAERNRLCPPNPYPQRPEDWLRTFAVTMAAAQTWSAEPDLTAWLESTRLNMLRGAAERAAEPRMAEAIARFGANVRPGMAAVQRLLAEVDLPAQRGTESVPAHPSVPPVASTG